MSGAEQKVKFDCDIIGPGLEAEIRRIVKEEVDVALHFCRICGKRFDGVVDHGECDVKSGYWADHPEARAK